MNDPIKEAYVESLEEAKKIVLNRGEDYGGFTINDYMPHGHASYHQMCFLKVQRALSETRNDRDPSDSLLDLINYAAFWLGYCREEEKKYAQEIVKVDPIFGKEVPS